MILKKDNDKSIAQYVKGNHSLIMGNNTDFLSLIQDKSSWFNNFDVVYIDPPYNKNVKLRYSDKDDSWSSNMKNNLSLARNVMSKDWFIFISIDTAELFNLKSICDEVFGSKNFVELFNWCKTETPSNLSKKSKKSIEYILCYQKEKNKIRFLWPDKEPSWSNWLLNQSNKVSTLIFPSNIVKTSIVDWIVKKGIYESKNYTMELLEDTTVKDGVFITDVVLKWKFKWKQEKLNNEISKGTKIKIPTNRFSPSYEKLENQKESPWNIIDRRFWVWTNENATSELEDILWKWKKFDYPKPLSLLTFILSFFENKNIKVLDFFAGSWTTWHAVLSLNDKDKGNRTFCLVTNNENNIFEEITYPRLKNVIHWYDDLKKNKKEWLNENVSIYNIQK